MEAQPTDEDRAHGDGEQSSNHEEETLQVKQPHLSLENGLKHPVVSGELSDLTMESPRGMGNQSLSEIPKHKGQSVMAIASLIGDEPQATDVVDLVAEDEPGPKGPSQPPDSSLEKARNLQTTLTPEKLNGKQMSGALPWRSRKDDSISKATAEESRPRA